MLKRLDNTIEINDKKKTRTKEDRDWTFQLKERAENKNIKIKQTELETRKRELQNLNVNYRRQWIIYNDAIVRTNWFEKLLLYNIHMYLFTSVQFQCWKTFIWVLTTLKKKYRFGSYRLTELEIRPLSKFLSNRKSFRSRLPELGSRKLIKIQISKMNFVYTLTVEITRRLLSLLGCQTTGVFFSTTKCAFYLKNTILCLFPKNVAPSKTMICFILNNSHLPMMEGIAFYALYKSRVLIIPCRANDLCLVMGEI